MELGEKLKQARLEAGLSQRQLCGDMITRNMLSRIENGAARPSMETLRYLASRLGKTVSWFLEEDAVTSPNQEVMAQARQAHWDGDFYRLAQILKQYRAPDGVFDAEMTLLQRLTTLDQAEQAMRQGKHLQTARILEELGEIGDGYCAEYLERQRLLLLARVQPKSRREICAALKPLDEELLLRARDALDRGDSVRAEHLLEAAEDRQDPQWQFLRGEVYAARREFEAAIPCYQRAEEIRPGVCAARLERCYRELGNYERAYFYACRQRRDRS